MATMATTQLKFSKEAQTQSKKKLAAKAPTVPESELPDMDKGHSFYGKKDPDKTEKGKKNGGAPLPEKIPEKEPKNGKTEKGASGKAISKANDDAALKARGFSDEQIARMIPAVRADLLDKPLVTADKISITQNGHLAYVQGKKKTTPDKGAQPPTKGKKEEPQTKSEAKTEKAVPKTEKATKATSEKKETASKAATAGNTKAAKSGVSWQEFCRVKRLEGLDFAAIAKLYKKEKK